MVYAGSTELLMSLSKAVGRFANVSIIKSQWNEGKEHGHKNT